MGTHSSYQLGCLSRTMEVALLEVSEREEGVVALHLLIGSLKTALGWSPYQDVNPVPTSPLADVITTAPSGPVNAVI